VVQWDQRGAGKTYAANDPKTLATTITIEQMTQDAEEVVRYLQKHCEKRKIFLLGHSWGSVLGVALAQRHPEWFYAYLGVGQLINAQRNEKMDISSRWTRPAHSITLRLSISCCRLPLILETPES
jgi:pimeloyl-ACP methyl ester carboxylesterase